MCIATRAAGGRSTKTAAGTTWTSLPIRPRRARIPGIVPERLPQRRAVPAATRPDNWIVIVPRVPTAPRARRMRVHTAAAEDPPEAAAATVRAAAEATVVVV